MYNRKEKSTRAEQRRGERESNDKSDIDWKDRIESEKRR